MVITEPYAYKWNNTKDNLISEALAGWTANS